jgi:hypothetical protein
MYERLFTGLSATWPVASFHKSATNHAISVAHTRDCLQPADTKTLVTLDIKHEIRVHKRSEA